MQSLVDSFLSFFNGLVAGWSQVFVMQPFEIIKVRLQTQNKAAPQYTGIVDCLSKIIKSQGFFALWKGSLTPLMGVGIMGSVRFGVYENLKKQMSQLKVNRGGSPKLSQPEMSLAALGAGVAASFFVCIVEHTRIRIQIQRGQADKIYTGSLDAAIKILKKHGVRGLFRGQGPTTVREASGLCFFFTTVERLTKKLSPPGVSPKQAPIYVPLIAGGVAGIFYWLFNYPFDYVKTLMQSDKFGQFKYPSMLSCFKQQYQLGGWKTFYRGYLICMLRSFPVNASLVVTYRIMQRLTGHNTSR